MKKTKERQEHTMRRGIYILPNLFTTASLFSGFYSLVASMRGDYVHAAIAIVVSFVLDGLDGRIARITHSTTQFGVEYDSLSDLVAFGVAPAILAYQWSLIPFGRCGWIVAFLFAACGALRLARFNVQVGDIDKKIFNGLPIPAAAGVIATSVLLWDYMGGTGEFTSVSILIAMVFLSYCMVSNVKYYSFKDLDFFTSKPFMTLVMIVFLFVVVLLEPQIMLFSFALSYSISGPMWRVVKMIKRRMGNEEDDSDMEEHHENI